MLTGLLLALLASFGVLDNATVVASSASGPVATAVAEDAVGARAAETAETRASTRTRVRARFARPVHRATRRLRSWWCRAVPAWRVLAAVAEPAGRAPPAFLAI